jgi:sugar/nucleoside kinase (ribokinase family)
VSTQKVFEVVGLGNALVDALVRMDEGPLLDELGYTRGQMTPISHADWEKVFRAVEAHGVEIQSGGSCANTIVGLGLMGAKSSYCGQIGSDALGALYAESLTDACGGHALSQISTHPTGKCLSIVSQVDAERTMLSDLGAAVLLEDLGDFRAQIQQSKVLHLTGYLLLGDPMATRALEAIEIAKAAGCLISLDAADPFVIGAVGDAMWSVIREHADIVFLNREEALALCSDAGSAALEELGRYCSTVVIKLGSEGSIVRHHGEETSTGIHPVEAIDTTGAGDAYAAGFLYGLVRGWPVSHAADLGSRVAAMTVAQLGAVVRDRARLEEAVRLAQPSQGQAAASAAASYRSPVGG